jgi:transposase
VFASRPVPLSQHRTAGGAIVSTTADAGPVTTAGTRHAGLVIGVDTHKDTHAAAACDAAGRVLAQLQVPATPAGYGQLLDWALAAAAGRPLAWAIESTRHYGAGLCQHLAAAGQEAFEISGTPHIAKRRAGKSDPVDAARAARELLAAPRPARPRRDGDREVLRLLMTDRDNAVQSAKTARTVLASVIVTAPAPLREQARGWKGKARARAAAALACPPGADKVTAAACQVIASLGQRACDLDAAARRLETQIAALVEDMIPGLVAAEPGMGALSAAQILLSWSHAGRIPTEQAFAMLAGAAPLPASSGATTRHRLSRLGDRQLNRALHIIARTRMRDHAPTRAYADRRRAQGKTDREIRRCIKRYLARHLYRTLNHRGLNPT